MRVWSKSTWDEFKFCLAPEMGRKEGVATERPKRKNPQYPEGLGFWSVGMRRSGNRFCSSCLGKEEFLRTLETQEPYRKNL